MYNMNSCETIEIFYNLRTDLDKLTVATNITKVILDVTTEGQNNYRTLQLFLNTLYSISETEKDISMITAIFKIRLVSILGFTPNVAECVNCKKREKLNYFSIKDNGLKCDTCGKLDKGAIHMMPETIDAIKYCILCNPKKIFSISIPEYAIRELELVGKLYLNEKLEKEYK